MKSRRSSSMDTSSLTDDVNNPMTKLMSMVKQSKKLFVGTYTERRYVKAVPDYRDIVTINKEEVEVIDCLTEIQKVVRQEFGEDKWLGITCNMVDSEVTSYHLWVELEKVPLGKYWFKIRSLKIYQNTIQLQLKCLRPFKDKERESFADIPELPPFDWREILTFHNACETAKFSAVLIMSIITITGNILYYLSEYFLRLTRELSQLIKALTPIIFGLYDFMTKCVGGILWLVYVLFRGDSGPNRQPGPMLMPLMPSPRRPIDYRRQYSNYNRNR